MTDLQAAITLIQTATGKGADTRAAAEKYPPPGPPPLFRLLPQAFEAFADSLPDS